MENPGYSHSEITFQLMVDAAPNALILINSESKIAYANTRAINLFDYEKSELIGQNAGILIPERLRIRHPEFVNSFFKTPKARAVGARRELYAVKKNGTEFPVEIGLNPLETSDGMMVLAAIIDITDRKKTENQFRLIVESAPNAMVLVNKDGIITLINQQTEKLFEYKRSELVGQKVEILIPNRFKNTHQTLRSSFYADLQARAMGAGRDLFAAKKDGSEIQVEIGLSPIETEEGTMVLASIIDISERKMKEAAIKKQIELEVKNKELEQFVYIASHDLREPLRTVSNYVKVIEEDYTDKLDENAGRYFSSMNKAVIRMDTLITSLLEYSRLGNKKTLVNVNIKKVIDDVLADLSSMLTSTKAQIHIGEMPTLKVYETEMRQLFQNLITNAVKFRKKDVPPVIHITSERSGGKWKFSVRDNGIGINEKYFDRIFHIFQRLNSREEFEGSGIGLANCKKIVELHGGEIWVESTYGAGSTFYFTIPRRLDSYEKKT